MPIPKKLHFIWIGDEQLRPDVFIATWRNKHPDFEVRIWGNHELATRNWRLRPQIDALRANEGQWCGIADLMRYEILLDEGGITLDADSVCLERLPDFLIDCTFFAFWENERVSPGLIHNGYVGTAPGHPLMQSLVNRLSSGTSYLTRFSWSRMRRTARPAWTTTGPVAFTKNWVACRDDSVSIFPSHFLLPIHHSGNVYSGSGPIYACELFASTYASNYEAMRESDPDEVVRDVRKKLVAAQARMQPALNA